MDNMNMNKETLLETIQDKLTKVEYKQLTTLLNDECVHCSNDGNDSNDKEDKDDKEYKKSNKVWYINGKHTPNTPFNEEQITWVNSYGC